MSNLNVKQFDFLHPRHRKDFEYLGAVGAELVHRFKDNAHYDTLLATVLKELLQDPEAFANDANAASIFEAQIAAIEKEEELKKEAASKKEKPRLSKYDDGDVDDEDVPAAPAKKKAAGANDEEEVSVLTEEDLARMKVIADEKRKAEAEEEQRVEAAREKARVQREMVRAENEQRQAELQAKAEEARLQKEREIKAKEAMFTVLQRDGDDDPFFAGAKKGGKGKKK